MAALVFREHLRREGLVDAVRVASGGTGSWHAGEPADRRARATLAAHGYPTRHVAAELDATLLDAGVYLCADREHVDWVRHRAPHAEVRLLREFDPTAPGGAEVPDPYYGGKDGFEEVLAMIERAMPELLAWVRTEK
jgi:protein-tyrosine phosphatase